MSIKPLTKNQFSEVVACYGKAFAGWDVVAGERLIRSSGPLLQQIGFEALRSGAYRPSVAVRVLIAPGVVLLPQFLDIRHREIFAREHASKWERVVEAIEQQIYPSVRAPLDVREVIELSTKLTSGSANDMCGLAALNAYIGNREEALAWCRQLDDKMRASNRQLEKWEAAYLRYTKDLAAAINAGEVDAYLQRQKVA
ncbi:hypothetical protein ED236_09305 [Pseudomethylobacillus aquaticus]|uniref:DUF4304 domain-containing protein n=1 Tax=Pseudomethylobacillus aquaticus TaxID=2676064 RepID=A0A3N0UZP4_9PROT|nr:hypothetical protein [Pseudomethylobacillus aquaticus]ROH85915.1 hypothetical protein ED236_09305 [Pseudomethylobacillus aquaticus]